MTNETGDNRLDRFLDGIMSQQEAAEFLENADEKEVSEAQELQSQIDDSLRRMVSGLNINEEEIVNQFLEVEASEGTVERTKTLPSPVTSNRRQWIQLVVAASLLIAAGLGVWMNSGPDRITPVKVPVRALTVVYAEKVQDGFRPYYICDDPQRFADTFQSKLNLALALAAMPDDRRMLGLSYLGGISSNTVAMLSEVKGEQVIVFVDREDEEGIEKAIQSTDPELNVFVERKFGLVFAEVTPLDSPGLIKYLTTADADTNESAGNTSLQ